MGLKEENTVFSDFPCCFQKYEKSIGCYWKRYFKYLIGSTPECLIIWICHVDLNWLPKWIKLLRKVLRLKIRVERFCMIFKEFFFYRTIFLMWHNSGFNAFLCTLLYIKIWELLFLQKSPAFQTDKIPHFGEILWVISCSQKHVCWGHHS